MADGALVLITRHDEEKDNEGGKAQQQDHTCQREPIHLPTAIESLSIRVKTGYLNILNF